MKKYNDFIKNNKYIKILLNLINFTTPSNKEYLLDNIILSYGFKKDSYGNYFIKNKSDILITAHADNYCKDVVKVNYDTKNNKISTDGSTILGGDDKIGITYILSLIDNRKKYNYYIFRNEEIGRLGSKNLFEKDKDFLKTIKLAITFDRKGTSDIITHQGGIRCCSDITANYIKDLSKRYNLNYDLNKNGGFSDVYTFNKIIPECINISTGVFNEHSTNEFISIDFFNKFIDFINSIDFNNIPINRRINNIRPFVMIINETIIVNDISIKINKIKLDTEGRLNCYFKMNNDNKLYKVYYDYLLEDKDLGRFRSVKIIPKNTKNIKIKDTTIKTDLINIDDNIKKSVISSIFNFINSNEDIHNKLVLNRL